MKIECIETNKYNNKCSKKCSNNTCKCNNNSCDNVLKKYHNLINQIADLKSESSQCSSNALCNVNKALDELNASINYLDNSVCTGNQASNLLSGSNCNFQCNINSPQCQAIGNQIYEYYTVQNGELLQQAYCLLEEVANILENAACCQEKGRSLGAEYVKCIHAKNSCSQNNCNQNCCCCCNCSCGNC